MNRILILALTDLSKDPRPKRQIRLLKGLYDLTTIGTAPLGEENQFFELQKPPFLINLLRVILLLKLKFYEKYYWDKYKYSLIEKLKGHDFDLIIAHEIRLLPLALKISGKAKIILDAHEYSPENFANNLIWRFFIQDYYKYLCNKYIRKAVIVTTVSKGIAQLYAKNFNVSVAVITSAAEYTELKPNKIDPHHIKIIHHGACSSSRKSELMIEAAKNLNSEFHLYLMFVVNKNSYVHYKKLKFLARKLRNVHFIKPVKNSELIKYCNQFDISAVFFPPVNTNLQFALPNKFFESIQSRLMLLVGPSIEMSNYVSKYKIGQTTKDFSAQSFANSVNQLTTNQIMLYKNQCDNFAKTLSSISENQKFLQIIKKTLLEHVDTD